jgi:hypothetical protein
VYDNRKLSPTFEELTIAGRPAVRYTEQPGPDGKPWCRFAVGLSDSLGLVVMTDMFDGVRPPTDCATEKAMAATIIGNLGG